MKNLNAPHWFIDMTAFEKNLAPKDKQLIGVSTILHKNKNKLVKELEQSIEEFIPDYKKYLIMKHIQVVRAEKTLQKADNSCWNLPSQKTNIKGLYLAGTDTRAFGSGGTMCAHSAFKCVDFIKKAFENEI